MAYEFFIDGVQLPVPPSKLQTKISNKNKTITLINDGEVNVLKDAGLTEVTFDVLLPQTQYPFAVYPNSFEPADYYLTKLELLKVNKQKFQFIVSRFSPGGKSLFRTNMKCSLEDYTITEDASNGLDVTVSIKLKQYRDFGTKTVVVKAATDISAATVSTTKVRETTKTIPKTYTVTSGDSLWAICKKQLNDGSKYATIAALNGIKNPNSISPGQVIKLG